MSKSLAVRIKEINVQMARALAEGKLSTYLDLQVDLGIMLRNDK